MAFKNKKFRGIFLIVLGVFLFYLIMFLVFGFNTLVGGLILGALVGCAVLIVWGVVTLGDL